MISRQHGAAFELYLQHHKNFTEFDICYYFNSGEHDLAGTFHTRLEGYLQAHM